MPGSVSRAFTLIEMLMVLVIMALLVTMTIPVYGVLRAKAGMAGCIGNLRVIGSGLNNYMLDHNMVWPQMPQGNFNDEIQRSKWWETTLESSGVIHKNWICPNDKQSINWDSRDEFRSSYAVTQFDEFPSSAFRWKQPWVIERGGFHGTGNVGPNMYMPDGTIQQGYAFPGPQQ